MAQEILFKREKIMIDELLSEKEKDINLDEGQEFIAKEKANVFTIRDMSEKQHIPQNYLAKIMRKLVQKGLLSSSPGPEGGYSLRKSTDEISLKDVYEAIEGDMQLIDCMEKNVVCELFNSCSQRSVWDHLQLHTLNFLNDISVEDIASNNFKMKTK